MHYTYMALHFFSVLLCHAHSFYASYTQHPAIQPYSHRCLFYDCDVTGCTIAHLNQNATLFHCIPELRCSGYCCNRFRTIYRNIHPFCFVFLMYRNIEMAKRSLSR